LKKDFKYFTCKTKVFFSSVLEGNTFSVNLLLFLGLTAFILIGFDLGSELSVEKDEINVIVGNLENVLTLYVNSANVSNIHLPLLGLIPALHFSFAGNIFLTLSQDRAPPHSL
jgi:hypothetical protein